MDHGGSIVSCQAPTRRIAAGLFFTFFTVQSAFVVLAPTLNDVAAEFGVTVGTVGQLRSAAAVAGVASAVALMRFAPRFGTRTLLVAGLHALSVGAAISALAPTFALLVLGQVVVGAGGAAVLAAGLAAAGDWPAPDRRARVLAWATVGQPAAWVAALPIIGALASADWRLGWVVVPLAAAVALALLPCNRVRNESPATSSGRAALRDGRIRRWAFGELMAYAGWGGTLVYAGALFVDSYGLSPGTVGLILGVAAAAYFPGTFAARRHLAGDLGPLLAGLHAALAAGSIVFGLLRPSVFVSTALFGLLVLIAGARGIAGSAFGLNAAPAQRLAIGGIRAATTQLGYLVGALAGGVAVDTGGYGVLGITLAVFFTAASLAHIRFVRSGDDAARRARRSDRARAARGRAVHT